MFDRRVPPAAASARALCALCALARAAPRVLLLALGIATRAGAEVPAPGLKLAFIGDQGRGAGSIAVLQLIAAEGADAILHDGDFDYSRILRATSGSSIAARARMRAPQRGQRSASTSKTRWSSSAHASLRGRGRLTATSGRGSRRSGARRLPRAEGSFARGSRSSRRPGLDHGPGSPDAQGSVRPGGVAGPPGGRMPTGAGIGSALASFTSGPPTAGPDFGRGPGTTRSRALAHGARTPW
jgi:hypothetical protein